MFALFNVFSCFLITRHLSGTVNVIIREVLQRQFIVQVGVNFPHQTDANDPWKYMALSMLFSSSKEPVAAGDAIGLLIFFRRQVSRALLVAAHLRRVCNDHFCLFLFFLTGFGGAALLLLVCRFLRFLAAMFFRCASILVAGCGRRG